MVALAAARAARPWQDRPAPSAQRAALDYDAIRRVRFRPEHALWRGDGNTAELQFFPLVGAGARSIEMFEIEGGRMRGIVLPGTAFDHDGVLPEAPAHSAAAAAGWRATWPLHARGRRDEVISFLGASYFRALGAGQHYGLSARGLAVNTAGEWGGRAAPEEFPAFTHFWFRRPSSSSSASVDPGAPALEFLALLDGPGVCGAYAFALRPGATTRVDVRARLFVRREGLRLGLAPLSSMFFFGENQPRADDFRPEVHDSDGLLVHTAEGERLWRPLINPARTFVTSFATRTPRGFGLLQRDRDFGRYEDLEAQYHRRPSAWIEPLSDWGAGRIELLQFPIDEETHDNIAAYWVGDEPVRPGQPLDRAWRIHWTLDEPVAGGVARVIQTRRGAGWRRASAKVAASSAAAAAEPLLLHVDFEGPALDGLQPAELRAVPSAGNGARVRLLSLIRHDAAAPGTGGATASAATRWRATLAVQRETPREPLELRLHLASATQVLSEVWSYALPGE